MGGALQVDAGLAAHDLAIIVVQTAVEEIAGRGALVLVQPAARHRIERDHAERQPALAIRPNHALAQTGTAGVLPGQLGHVVRIHLAGEAADWLDRHWLAPCW